MCHYATNILKFTNVEGYKIATINSITKLDARVKNAESGGWPLTVVEKHTNEKQLSTLSVE